MAAGCSARILVAPAPGVHSPSCYLTCQCFQTLNMFFLEVRSFEDEPCSPEEAQSQGVPVQAALSVRVSDNDQEKASEQRDAG